MATIKKEKPAPASWDHNTPQADWNIYRRLAWVARQVTYLAKDGQMDSDYMSYKYVSHDKVVAMYRKPILEAGLMLVTDVVDQQVREVEGARGRKAYLTEIRVAFTFVNVDNPEERVTYHMTGQGMDSNDKGSGKAISYTCKYGFLKGFFGETGEDADRECLDVNAAPEDEVEPEDDDHGSGHFNKTPIEDRRAYAIALNEVNGAIRELMSKYEITAGAVAELAGKPGDQMTVAERQRLVSKIRAEYEARDQEPVSPRSMPDMPMHLSYKCIQAYRQELGETDEADWLLLIQNEMGTRDLDSLSASQLHEFARRLEQHVLAKRSGALKGEKKNGK